MTGAPDTLALAEIHCQIALMQAPIELKRAKRDLKVEERLQRRQDRQLSPWQMVFVSMAGSATFLATFLAYAKSLFTGRL